MTNEKSNLNKIIEEQADYYGLSVPKFSSFMSCMADIQELIEYEEQETLANQTTTNQE